MTCFLFVFNLFWSPEKEKFFLYLLVLRGRGGTRVGIENNPVFDNGFLSNRVRSRREEVTTLLLEVGDVVELVVESFVTVYFVVVWTFSRH